MTSLTIGKLMVIAISCFVKFINRIIGSIFRIEDKLLKSILFAGKFFAGRGMF